MRWLWARGTANISVAERAVRCDASPPHVEVCCRGIYFSAGFHHLPLVARLPSRFSCVCRRSCARRDLGTNQLSGSLPTWLGSMKGLTKLCVSGIASAHIIATAHSFAASVCLFSAGALPRPLVGHGLCSRAVRSRPAAPQTLLRKGLRVVMHRHRALCLAVAMFHFLLCLTPPPVRCAAAQSLLMRALPDPARAGILTATRFRARCPPRSRP